jgi:hypothetical protein
MEPERRGDVKFETVIKRSLTIPDEDEIKEFVAEKIKSL